MAKTFSDRFSDRLNRVKGSIRPNSSSGELAYGNTLVNYKNAAADWRFEGDSVQVRLHSIVATNFNGADTHSTGWSNCRSFRSVGSLVNALTDSVRYDRLVEVDGSMKLCSDPELGISIAFEEWIRTNRDALLALVVAPASKSKEQGFNAEQWKRVQLNAILQEPAPNKAAKLRRRVAMLLAAAQEPQQQQEAQEG